MLKEEFYCAYLWVTVVLTAFLYACLFFIDFFAFWPLLIFLFIFECSYFLTDLRYHWTFLILFSKVYDTYLIKSSI